MKKITIFGSYNGSSIGDTAIILGLLDSLSRLTKDELVIDVLVTGPVALKQEMASFNISGKVSEIIVFNRRMPGTGLFCRLARTLHKVRVRFLKASPIAKSVLKSSLSDSHLLLIGGGNLIMDLYPTWPGILEDVCEQARLAGVPYSFVGVGASPITTGMGAALLRRSVDGAQAVYFRDEASRLFCQRMLSLNDGMVGPDLALGLNLVDQQGVPMVPAAEVDRDECMVINAASVFSHLWPYQDERAFQGYISGMCRAVNDAAAQLGMKRLVLISSNPVVDDYGSRALFEAIRRSSFNGHVSYADGAKTVRELFDVCRASRYALVTRLHAGIIAHKAGCKVLAIAYQPKVKDVLEECGIATMVMAMEDLLDERKKPLVNLDTNREYLKGDDSKRHLDLVDGILRDVLARAGIF